MALIATPSVQETYDNYAAYDQTRLQLNRLVRDLRYHAGNHTGTVAPGIAKGTASVRPKTANNTTFVADGSPKALAASDDLWDLTTADQGVGVVPVASFIKYRLLHTGAAIGVQSSSIAAAAADCEFPAVVPMGSAVLGMITVATDATHTFTPGTTHLDAAGITTTYLDGSDGSEFLAATVTP